MYGVVGEVKVDPARTDEAEKMLLETIVPAVKAEPGFVAAYWFRSEEGTGRSFVVFDSEEAARKASENRPALPDGGPVTVIRFEVLPVIAHA